MSSAAARGDRAPSDASPTDTVELPLFPLQMVLFPAGRLPLQIFEARYLDLMSRCLREHCGFGVVALRSGSEVRRPGETEAAEFEDVGCVAHVVEADMPRPGLMTVLAVGATRFRLHARRCGANGLWMGDVTLLAPDAIVPPGEAHALAVDTLRNLVAQATPVAAPAPVHLDDAAWIGNRWAEALPLPLPMRQHLMAMDDPLARLDVVTQVLRDNHRG